MDKQSLIQLIGGLGMFLLGIHHLTEGLKGIAGDALRRALNTLVAGKWSAMLTGTVFTAIIQSSSATTLMVIGFVSAGLVTFPQAVAVVLGANLGTTATSWLVAVFGFKLKIAVVALPMLGVGAFLWLLGKGRIRAVGAMLAGFGLIFTGIDYLQAGMAGVDWNLSDMGGGMRAQWLLAGIGLLMTVAMQSSSAAGATTLVALAAGTVTLDQAFALVIGQNIGTTVTAAMAAVGGGMAVKRTALAHILFNVITGLLAMFILQPLGLAARWLGELMQDDSGVLALAAFNTLFNVIGLMIFFPWLGGFARGIVWLTGRSGVSAVERLDPTVAKSGSPVALEAAWLALAELGAAACKVLKSRIDDGDETAAEIRAEIPQVRMFIENLRFEGTEAQTLVDRRVRIWHALDHLSKLADDLAEPSLPGRMETLDEEFRQARLALEGWISGGAVDLEKVVALETSSLHFTEARKDHRARLLEDVALGRFMPQQAATRLEIIRWTDDALYHAWRLAHSLNASKGSV